MTIKKLFITVAAVSTMAIFSGCQTTAEISAPAAQQPSSVSQTTQQHSETDKAAYAGALQLNNPAMCDKISEDAAQQECKTALVDQAQSNEAQQKMNATICEKLSTKDKQDACKIQVEVLVKQQLEREKLKAELASNNKIRVSIDQSGDYTRCKELTMESAQLTCEVNLLSSKAIDFKTESWCDKATIQKAKTICHAMYQDLMNHKSPATPAP